MSETTTTTDGQNEQPNGGENDSGYTPPATQQDLDRIISERVKREQAKFADYKDLKAKADRLAQIEASNLSEAEKAAKKIADADAAVAQVPAQVADALRTHLVALHQINDEDAELFLTATDPELLLKQVDRLVGRADDRKKTGAHVPGEGKTTTTVEGKDREVLRSLFGGPS